MTSKVLLVILMLAAFGYCYRLERKTKRCSAPMDLVLVLESSDKVERYWDSVKRFLLNHVEDIWENGTHVGIITFSTNPEVKIKLNRYKGTQLNTFTIKRDISINLKEPQGGKTDIVKALGAANTMFTEESGMRKDAAKVCVVLTTGIQDDEAYVPTAAEPLKGKGVEIFSVGIGEDMDVMNLIQIASIPDYVWSGRNTDKVLKKIKEIKEAKC